MIFKANNMDASANNLGTLSNGEPTVISQDTLDLLSFFGKTWGDTEKQAINTFLESFKVASWKSKVKTLIMPILMPEVDGLVQADIQLSNSVYRKNLADLDNDISTNGSFLNPAYALLGVNENGFVLQNATSDSSGYLGTIYNNASINYDVSSYSITNKSAHFGVYRKADVSFKSGYPSTAMPYVSADGSVIRAQFYNSLLADYIAKTSPYKGLYLINGDANLVEGKSYIENGSSSIIPTTFGTQTETTQTAISAIRGNLNIHNKSATSFMTFGDYLTDAELLEYKSIINNLMNVLVTD